MDNVFNNLKKILVQLAIDDKLPLDMNDLNPQVFAGALHPMLSFLSDLREDAKMSLSGKWEVLNHEETKSCESTVTQIDEILNRELTDEQIKEWLEKVN